jgi:HK97 family phage portal protein
MSWLDSLAWLAGAQNKTQAQPTTPKASRIWFSGTTRAGERVTNETALKNAAIWACVQYLTKTVGQLPWRVRKERDGGGSELVSSNPADYLLHHRPCPDMGSFSWRQSMLGSALIWGNAYAEIQWDNRGAPFAMWPIHPDRVKVRRNDTGELIYDVWNEGGGMVTLAAEDVFHLRGFGDGPVGYNVIEYAAQSIGWAQATEAFGSEFFANGMNPSGVIEQANGKAISPEAQDELREEMRRVYFGKGKDRTAILDVGMKFTKITNSPDEAQFIETRWLQIEEICRWFGVPPHKVMHLLRATFSNIENQSIEVVVDSITPWVKAFEEEANYKLFGKVNRQGLYTKMDLKGLLRGDAAARAAMYTALYGTGAMSTNDICYAEELNPVGAVGDQRFISTNLQPLDPKERAAEKPAKTTPSPSEPPKTAASLRAV